jgi:phage terminase small subunit
MAGPPRQAAFIREYLKNGGNATEAAKAAGYSERTAYAQGSRLLKDVEVKKAIAAKVEKIEEKYEVQTAYILKNLVEVVERCMQRAPVMVRVDGGQVQAVDEEGRHVWEFNSNGVNKALELLGKYKKLFTDKVEASGADGGPIVVEIRKEEAA